MVQDSKLPKNNNLNTETNTHFDTISANDQNINDNNKEGDTEKLPPEDNNIHSINVNYNDTDIQGSAQDSNTRSNDLSGMVRDSELPKNNNLNTETNTHFDTISANDQNINDNNKEGDTDIQNSNETLIDEYETAQDNNNLSPNNDGRNTSSNKEIADDGLNDIEQAKEDTNNNIDNIDANDIDDDLSNGINTSSTHNNKESADDGLNDIKQAKEDTNNEDNMNDIDNDNADDVDDDDDPEYTNPEEEQNPKLRAIQSVQGNKKKKKKEKRRTTEQISPQIFYITTEVDSDPMKKDKIMRRSEYVLIAPIPEDRNDLVDKHFSDNHHMKSIYFNDDEEYMQSFEFTQNEHYDKIIEKLNDPQESMTINQNLEHTYD